jgi:hypothetical protein
MPEQVPIFVNTLAGFVKATGTVDWQSAKSMFARSKIGS